MSDSPSHINVLFVCTGNICRSPAGEGVFRKYVEDSGNAGRILIDSAGTIAYHTGEPADPRMREAAFRRGYSLDSNARQVNNADLDEFDLVVAMDHEHLHELQRLAGGVYPHIRMLGSFLDGGRDNPHAPPVPDPYYGGARGFEIVLDMLEASCPAMLDHCLELLDSK